MNAKRLFAALIASACAAGAYAADAPHQANAPQTNFANTLTPYEVTAQNQAVSSGADVQAKNAGAGQQAVPAVNFTNTLEPWVVTAQSADGSARNAR